MTVAFAVPPFTRWRDELWDTILDLSILLDEGSWVLVGSQAVVAHALANGGDGSELSHDPDPLGRLVTTASALTSLRRSFTDLGFEPDGPQPVAHQYRFRREADGADGEPSAWAVHVIGVTTLQGGDQALARRVRYQARKGLRAPWVPVPDLLSTVVYEASQYAVDRSDSLVHARNAVYLVSLMEKPAIERERLTMSDRRALQILDGAIGEREHALWNSFPAEHNPFAQWRAFAAP